MVIKYGDKWVNDRFEKILHNREAKRQSQLLAEQKQLEEATKQTLKLGDEIKKDVDQKNLSP